MKKNICMALVLMSGVAGIQAMEQELPSGVVPLPEEEAAQIAKKRVENDKAAADEEQEKNAKCEKDAVLHLRLANAELLSRRDFYQDGDKPLISPSTFMQEYIAQNLQPVRMIPSPLDYRPQAGLSSDEQGAQHAAWALKEHNMVVANPYAK